MSKRRLAQSEASLAARSYGLGRWFTGARREGFLALLSPEAWHTLSAVLSFTTREGQRLFTLDQLATGLGTSREQARERLAALADLTWRGAPLLTPVHDAYGELCGATLAPIELLAGVQPGAEEPAPPPAPTVSPGAVPLAEASGEPVSAELASQLAAVGLNGFQVDWLLRSYPAERIRRQLGWLPAREAHNPPALLIRAIEQDWDPPREAA